MVGPLDGSGFESLGPTQQAGFPAHFPEIFHFADGIVNYPQSGTTDPQACGSVSLDTTGATVWYRQSGPGGGWFSTPTVSAAIQPPVLTLPPSLDVEATGASRPIVRREGRAVRPG